MTEDILVTRLKDEPGATTLAVEAPATRVQAAERKAAVEVAKSVRLPGFRKGKVPADVIRRRFGSAIRETAIRELVQDSWKKALDQEKLEPIAEPHVHGLELTDNQPLKFEFHVEVKPNVSMERIGGFEVKKVKKPVADADVEEQLEGVRRQNAPLVPVEGKPQLGDHVSITLATVTDGEVGEEKPYNIEVGSGQALPDVEEKILQMTAGESEQATIKFPDDFPDESKRGHATTVELKLVELKRLDLPTLDDSFAKEIGDFETIDDVRKAIREDLERNAARDAEANARRQLIELITTANNVPAPRPMVERLLTAYARAYEVGEERFQEFATELMPMVEAQVKRDLVLDYVSRAHQIQATEDDIDERVEEMAKARKVSPGDVYTALQKENRIKDLERSITEEKVFTFLLEQSTITES